MFERRSALTAQLAADGRDGVDGRRALRVSEVRGLYLAQLAVFRGREALLRDALQPLGADLAAEVGSRSADARCRIFHVARGQFWIVTPDSTWLSQLALAVPPHAGAATLLSHGRVRIAVEGLEVRALLAKGIAIDLHPDKFRIGDFALTGLHHTGIFVERTGADRFELVVLRTFAASIWDWLLDAALPLGYELDVEGR